MQLAQEDVGLRPATVVGLGFLDTALYLNQCLCNNVYIFSMPTANLSDNASRANPSEQLPLRIVDHGCG